MNQENDTMSSLVAFTGSGILEIAGGDPAANATDQFRTGSIGQAEVKTALQRGEETSV